MSELARMIRVLAERHLAEVDRIVHTYFNARDKLEPVGREKLLDRLRSGEIVLLDVRPAAWTRAASLTRSLPKALTAAQWTS